MVYHSVRQILPDLTAHVRPGMEDEVKLPDAWSTTTRPHLHSSRCSRFKDTLPTWQRTDTNQRATYILEARCEISSSDIERPAHMVISSDSNFLALSSMGGWKDRSPIIAYYDPRKEGAEQGVFKPEYEFTADLTSSVDDILLMEDQKLVFVADHKRIKSYQWTKPRVSRSRTTPLPVHTIESSKFAGPMALLSGQLLRAGKGCIAAWDLDTLQTHGTSGGDIVGARLDDDDMDTWREDTENIEPSTGTPTVSHTIKLEGSSISNGREGLPNISTWHQHPSNANIMLCGMDADESNTYCHAYDLQAGGKIANRFIGHGAAIDGFSSSRDADPNVFLTWCYDSLARLYDVRQPLPVMTIQGDKLGGEITSAAFACPDSIPCWYFF